MGAWEDVVDDLYGGLPGDFVARRDAAARAARDAGDRDLAGRVGALRRPTVAAWAVNILVRDDPDLAGRLRDVGEGLREAERTLDGPALRELTTQRRRLVAGLAQQAGRLAAAAGQKVSPAAAQEVERTLTAALLDPAAAEHVTSGALVHAQEHVGFGASVAAPSAAAPPARAPVPVRERSGEAVERAARSRAERARERAAAALRAAEDALARARTRHEDAARADLDARRGLDDAEQARDAAYRAEDELVRALADVRRRLAEARSALPRADERLVAAQQHARRQEQAERSARRALDRAVAAVEHARAVADDGGGPA